MSFPKYPKYKDSGVEWLGEVPEHWERKPLRSVFNFSTGLNITKENLQDEGVFCVNYGEIHSKYGFQLNPDIHPLRCVSAEYLRTNPDSIVANGDFVFADTSEDLEGSGNFTHIKSDKPVFAGYHTIIARPRTDTCSLFLAFQLHSSVFRTQIQRQVKGIKVFTISQKILKGHECWLPPKQEQRVIAEFLDAETAKIDELVAEQRRLIELLREKRQAVISHAVTKGLNPNAPMKPSGIEWLGDVPEHWDVRRIKHLTSSIKAGPFGSSLTKDTYVESGYRVYGQEQVIPNDFTIGDYYISQQKFDELAQCSVSPGDVLISCVGTFGKIAIVPDNVEPGIINPRLLRLRCNALTEARYLVEVLRSQVTFEQFSLFSRGGTMDVISISTLSEIVVPVPPVEELSALRHFIHSEIEKCDALTAEAQRGIELLQERRIALISAAVTGKIDVRSFAPQIPEVA